MTTDKTFVSAELSRDLTLFHTTMMGLGMMIGAGVFLGVGNSIHVAGPGGVMLTFALNGVIALFTAMSYAELSSAVPRAGGAYNFARIGFGRGTSFIAGWVQWFASCVAGSLYAVTLGIYIVRYLEGLGLLEWMGVPDYVLQKVVAVLVAALFIYVNYRGASETGRVGAVFTLAQTVLLLFIGVVGVVVCLRDPARLENFDPFLPQGWSKLLVTMGFTYVAFEGYEVIAQAGDETIDPKRNLPKAMLYSVLIVTFTYVGVAFATVVAVKAGSPGVDGEVWRWIGSFREKGFGEAVARLMPMGNLLLTLAVIFAATSALNATVYSATRASYALGRDRMLPAMFAWISRRRRTPWAALLFTGVIVVVVAVFLPTMDVASSASIMFLCLFFLVNVCVITIRRNMGDELEYGYLLPLFPLPPLIAILCQAILAAELREVSIVAWIVAPAWIVTGVLIYQLYSRARTVATPHEVMVFADEKAPKRDEYRIMVSVANPGNAIELVRNTYKLCGAKNARVELLHMVPVPEQVPLADAERYMLEGKEGILEAMMALGPMFTVGTTLRYCRNIARGILSAVSDKRIDMLIMGWHGGKGGRVFSLGSTIDPVVERAACNVVILKGCGGNREFRRILVPVAGGPNGAFALEVASILVDKDEGEIVALTVARPGGSFDLDGFVDACQGRLQVPRRRVTTRAVEAPDVVQAILDEAEGDNGYDMVVLGHTREPVLRRVGRDSVPEAVARECTKPLVMVKASGGIRSWLKRWI